MNVEICEPEVSPMAVRGAKAEEVVASVFGDWVRAQRCWSGLRFTVPL